MQFGKGVHAVGLAAAMIGAAIAAPATAQDEATAESDIPTDLNILTWTDPQRDFAFPRMEDVAPVRTIANGETFRDLPSGPDLEVSVTMDGETWTLDAYLEDPRAAGVVVILNGDVRLERYRMGADIDTRWTSFSVAKYFTSTLVGAAIVDGHIESLVALVTAYIP